MTTRPRHPERREDALSRERIVGAAVELLDDKGESGLTFRALAAQLETGPGAIYWHVANKNELLAAATAAVLAPVMSAEVTGTPQEVIRAVTVGVFDAIEAHPWVGAQLSANPTQPTVLRIFERIGQQVRALGVPPSARFTAASSVLHFVLGVGGQNAALARTLRGTTNRSDHLAAVSAEWADLDPDEFPFTRAVADELRDHDDRAQFLDGVDLILAGIARLR
ncbi:TetR family transcriptional regulator [Saccharothrix sp. 6-C]|uniref:TetR/AcrR family transcriptional regulator n=1 Tax=Saccharothrix sp. 6-C TaxID=2781735 RepID=UPI0019172305|nr:TetR family transcriptional regulator [Saccharothrix sp. 6-C]QQQ79705.1 TetR family transcriptional regulator [Saccharothrix sp. 6-C]